MSGLSIGRRTNSAFGVTLDNTSESDEIPDAPTGADTTLESLTIGTLSLVPAFSSDVQEYTLTTTNNRNKVTATPTDSDADVEISLGATPIDNGTAAVWETGDNTLSIKVTNNGEATTYIVHVAKE